jgi:hypothetical protein
MPNWQTPVDDYEDDDLDTGVRRELRGAADQMLIVRRLAAIFGRLASPSMLAFSMCLLLFPFLEIQCASPSGQVTVVSQSGVQTLYGGYSIAPELEKDMRMGSNQRGNQGGNQQSPAATPQRESVGAAPLMVVILLILGVAIVAGLALPWSIVRLPVVAACIALALLTLAVQMLIGFPLEKSIQDSVARSSAPAQPNNQPVLARQDEMARMTASMFRCRYTPWFWIWAVIIGGALLPVLFEAALRIAAWSQASSRRLAVEDNY